MQIPQLVCFPHIQNVRCLSPLPFACPIRCDTGSLFMPWAYSTESVRIVSSFLWVFNKGEILNDVLLYLEKYQRELYSSGNCSRTSSGAIIWNLIKYKSCQTNLIFQGHCGKPDRWPGSQGYNSAPVLQKFQFCAYKNIHQKMEK